MGVKHMSFIQEDLEALSDAELVCRGDREIGAGTYTELGYVGAEILAICKSIIWQYQNVRTISKKQRQTLLEFQYYNDPDSDWDYNGGLYDSFDYDYDFFDPMF